MKIKALQNPLKGAEQKQAILTTSLSESHSNLPLSLLQQQISAT
jgi:hypothetical protein